MREEFDVAIAGASLAGASAAIRLGQAGLRVALIDKASFPRRKPCGEGMSCYGLDQLAMLGIKDSVLALPHLKYFGYKLRSGRASAIVKTPWGSNITIQRSFLDARVFEHALQFSTVTPFLSQPVTAINENSVSLGALKLFAKNIIIASGSNSPLLKQIKCRTKRSGPRRAGISVTFKGEFLSEPRYINIILKKEFEIYCTPLAGKRLNVSILTRAGSSCDLRASILSPEIQREVFEECCFRGEVELPPQGRVNIGNIRRTCQTSGILLAGDAKEELDPIGGMGMSHALHSGIQAAESIIRTHSCKQIWLLPKSAQRADATAMRLFTSISYQTLIRAKRYPFLLSLAASSIGQATLKFLTKQLA